MNLRIHRLALAEIDHEVDYYESREAGLGAELEDEIAAVFYLCVAGAGTAPKPCANGCVVRANEDDGCR